MAFSWFGGNAILCQALDRLQRITVAAETNAACSRGSADTQRDSVTPSITIPPLAKRRRR